MGSVVLALLASQHHALHMLLMLGAGGAPAFMTVYPVIRRLMLLIALLAALWTIKGLRRRSPQPAAVIALNWLSVGLTLGLIGWSVARFGL